MTPDELNAQLDAMQAAAATDGEKPGLITVQTDEWIYGLGEIKPTCAALHDGLRHRDIVVIVGSSQTTAVLSRAEAGDRGQPYRDLTPKP